VIQRLVQTLILASALLFSAASSADPVRMVGQVPYAENAEIAENVRIECVQIQTQLAEFTQQFAERHGIRVELEDWVEAEDAGRILIVRIDDAVSMGNAFSGHRKFTRISGELYQDGEKVAGFRARRNSGGGAFGGYKGSCSVLGRTVRTLGRDIANWLDNPRDGARLGDM
jgi:hypothetical protein